MLATRCYKRSIKEFKAYHKSPKSLIDQGFILVWNPKQMTQIFAMILGPAQTIYGYSFMFFRIDLPDDYPFSPPKVKFLNSDGHTRLHPNLYVDGKVCLSILGTWRGPGWQPSLSIEAVVVSIRAMCLGVDKPLLCEPGLSPTESEMENYDAIVSQAVLTTSVIAAVRTPPLSFKIPVFQDAIKETFITYVATYLKRCRKMGSKWDGQTLTTKYCCMRAPIDFKSISEQIKELYEEVSGFPFQ